MKRENRTGPERAISSRRISDIGVTLLVMLRRSFIGTAAAAALNLSAQDATQRGVRLGFDSYSLRAWKWKALDLLGYAASMKLDSVQISGLDEFESLEPAHLAK